MLEKVLNLGQLGDVVKVKEGYARNFLIPHGKARRATDAAIKEFEARRADLEKAQSDRLSAAEAVNAKLSGSSVRVPAKAGVDGKLFGSVTNFDIAEALAKQGFVVNKGRFACRKAAEAGGRTSCVGSAAYRCRCRRHGAGGAANKPSASQLSGTMAAAHGPPFFLQRANFAACYSLRVPLQ